MRAHYLQHVPFEGLGCIKSWLFDHDFEISCTPFYEHAVLPEPNRIDLLIVMGGPMSVNDEDDFPWLIHEKRFIKKAVDLNIPVLGICLGAQLIASALGARVYQNEQKEIGWFDVQNDNRPVDGLPNLFEKSTPVFHWHGETFDLPDGAVCFAGSKVCKHQAFIYKKHVIGLQFHLETTVESAGAIIDHCREELVDAPYIQPETQILSALPEQYEVNHQTMHRILEYLEAQIY